jgi:hypothetical protein
MLASADVPITRRYFQLQTVPEFEILNWSLGEGSRSLNFSALRTSLEAGNKQRLSPRHPAWFESWITQWFSHGETINAEHSSAFQLTSDSGPQVAISLCSQSPRKSQSPQPNKGGSLLGIQGESKRHGLAQSCEDCPPFLDVEGELEFKHRCKAFWFGLVVFPGVV